MDAIKLTTHEYVLIYSKVQGKFQHFFSLKQLLLDAFRDHLKPEIL